LKALEAIAPKLGVTILPVAFAKPADFDRAFAEIRGQRADALDVLGWSLINAFRKRIAARALANNLPTIYSNPRHLAAGGLMSYGASVTDMYRRAATYVDKILKGARPAELPVERPTKFILTINLKTAKALGIEVPRAILLRADEVIE
jgi:putative ABC transport system substrate-binding protein